MTRLNQQGNLLQNPQEVPADIARFSFNDQLQTLADGRIAWTDTSGGTLQLYLLSP